MKKKFLIYLLILCLVSISSCTAEKRKLTENDTEQKLNESEGDTTDSFSVTIAAVGDIMLGSGYPDESYLPENCGEQLISAATNVLKSADITFGNLEGAVINYGNPAKKCIKSSNCYAFRMNECAIDVLKNSGFDILNIGNNHSYDFGEAGQSNTTEVLEKNEIKYNRFRKNSVSNYRKKWEKNSVYRLC